MKKSGLFLVIMVAIVSLLVIGCGGGGEEAGTTATPSGTTTGATTTVTKTPTVTQTPTATKTPTTTKTPTPTSTSTSGKTLADIYGVGKSIGDVKYDEIITESGQTQSTTSKVYLKDAWLSDKMKFRYEMSVDGTTTILIMDLATQIAYSYLPDENMAYKIDMSQAGVADPTEDSDKITPLKVGTETIDGKLCDVYEWTYQGAATKEWIWRDKSFTIKEVTTTSSGTTTVEHKNIVFGTLSNDLFQLPAGVQIVQF